MLIRSSRAKTDMALESRTNSPQRFGQLCNDVGKETDIAVLSLDAEGIMQVDAVQFGGFKKFGAQYIDFSRSIFRVCKAAGPQSGCSAMTVKDTGSHRKRLSKGRFV